MVWSPLKHHKAIFLRTDGTKVPYDQSIGNLTIESESGKKRYLSLKGFRHVEIHWINERLLYIRSNIGHVVSVNAIFDIEEGIWIYRKSEEYVK